MSEIPGVIVFADDPAGFSYGEAPNGNVLVYDSDGQTVKTLAADMDDFFSRLVFGVDAKDFAGADWFAELKAARIVI